MPRLVILALCLLTSGVAWAETPGKDGTRTVSGAGTVLNEYAAISGTANVGAASVTVVNRAGNLPSLSPGDLVLIYQASGATLSSADTAGYGAVTSLNSAGAYEYQTVATVSGSTITFQTYNGQCSGLRSSYSSAGGAQVIRVPQYRALTVSGGGSVVALPWDGTRGGVVALAVQTTLSLQGSLNASAAGFRGGQVDNLTTPAGQSYMGYRSTLATDGAEKGEGIGGYRATLPLGAFYGRGAAANGGGGGNGHNAGGGGGANGNNGSVWAGQGVPDTSAGSWSQAWNLDPSLNANTRNAGGGRGGYTYARAGNPLTTAPGAASWGNDFRRELGGLGGRPLAFARASRLYFGGGGGAGDGNNSAAGAGGRGGGLVIVLAGQVTGSGEMRADGAAGDSTTPAHNDAPGGGGAGGTVVVQANSMGGVSVRADGGAGGNQLITNEENEGPGGGGGGGVIALTSSASVSFARGGVNGTTLSSSMTSFPPNGATQGALGLPNTPGPSRAELPFCYAPAGPLEFTKTSANPVTTGALRFNVPGADVVYELTVTNPGFAVDAGSLVITDPLPAELILFTGGVGGTGAGGSAVEFIDGSPPSGVACCTAAQVTYSDAATGAFAYTPTAEYDPLIRRIRISPSGAMTDGTVQETSFRLRFRARVK